MMPLSEAYRTWLRPVWTASRQGAALELALDAVAAAFAVDLHDGRRMGDPQQLGQHRRHGGGIAVVGHQAHQHEVRADLLRDGGQHARDAERVRAVDRGVLHVDRAVRAHAERGAQGLGHAVGTDRSDDDFGAGVGVLDPERLFERKGVVAVDLELDAVFLDPRAIGVDVEARVLVRHLFQTDQDLHREGLRGGEPPKASRSGRGARRAER
jgi:hypothetical protein